MTNGKVLAGPRFVLGRADAGYPVALRDVPRPPEVIYGVGNPGALTAEVTYTLQDRSLVWRWWGLGRPPLMGAGARGDSPAELQRPG